MLLEIFICSLESFDKYVVIEEWKYMLAPTEGNAIAHINDINCAAQMITKQKHFALFNLPV